jgi:Cu/Ag efflux protein CusF
MRNVRTPIRLISGPAVRALAVIAVTVIPSVIVLTGCSKPAEQPPAQTGAPAQTSAPAATPAAKEHAFRGKVEQVDLPTKTFSVNGEAVEGWMGAMTMIYKTDNADVLTKVKAGDQITAKVYDGDFQTLHDVQIVPPK